MYQGVIALEDDKHIFRTSDRLAWKKCRREHNFSSIVHRNLVPIKGSKPLEYGTDWHEAMAALYDPISWPLWTSKDKSVRDIQREIVRQTFLQANRKRRLEYEEEGLDVSEDFAEREALGIGMLNGYFDWAVDVDKFTPVKVEVDFEVPILDPITGEPALCACHGAPIVYQGRLDGIVQDPQGWYWILEHKTAAQMGPTDHLALDEQTGSYAWAIRQMLGIRVQGVIYNEAVKKVAHTPQALMRPQSGRNFSVNKQQDTTYEVALKFLIDQGEDLTLYEDFLDWMKYQGNKFFRRTQVHRNVFELEDQGRRIFYESQEMLNPMTVPYPNPSRFTCTMCAFKAPCLAMNDGSDYEFLLREDYRVRTKVEVGARRAR